jgi:hypothetical protein
MLAVQTSPIIKLGYMLGNLDKSAVPRYNRGENPLIIPPLAGPRQSAGKIGEKEMTIKVSKENVDVLSVRIKTPIELRGTCDLCGRPIHGLFGMLEAHELKTTRQASSRLFVHDGGAFIDCINPIARFIVA